MKSLALTLLLSLAVSPALSTPNVGAPAPAFAVRDADGHPVSLAAFHGRTVVLEWTNNGCPFVGHMYASGVMQGLQRRAAAEGVTWLTIVSSAPGQQGYLTPAEVGPWKARVGAAAAECCWTRMAHSAISMMRAQRRTCS